MGMFDTVYADCPKCGTEIMFQTGGGVCELKNYRSTSVPIGAAEGVYGSETCYECKTEVKLRPAIERVEMVAYKVTQNECGDEKSE